MKCPQHFPHQPGEMNKGYFSKTRGPETPLNPHHPVVPTTLCCGDCSWWRSSTLYAEVKKKMLLNLYLYLEETTMSTRQDMPAILSCLPYTPSLEILIQLQPPLLVPLLCSLGSGAGDAHLCDAHSSFFAWKTA